MEQVLDAYCERSGPGLWAEPLNAVTNLAFIVAAAFALLALRTQTSGALSKTWDLNLLIVLLCAIGIGSWLWHSLATPWAALTDVLPINLFIALFLFSFLRRGLNAGIGTAIGAVIAFEAVSFGMPMLISPRLFNGSIAYLPALLLLAGFSVELHRRGHPLAVVFLAGTLIFSVSLLFRTVDRELCMLLPIGTHFLWHLLNATLLYLMLRGLIDYSAGRSVRLAPSIRR
jgi:hypothetical protein